MSKTTFPYVFGEGLTRWDRPVFFTLARSLAQSAGRRKWDVAAVDMLGARYLKLFLDESKVGMPERQMLLANRRYASPEHLRRVQQYMAKAGLRGARVLVITERIDTGDALLRLILGARAAGARLVDAAVLGISPLDGLRDMSSLNKRACKLLANGPDEMFIGREGFSSGLHGISDKHVGYRIENGNPVAQLHRPADQLPTIQKYERLFLQWAQEFRAH